MREYRRAWYYNNKDKQIAKQKERKRAIREVFNNYKKTLFCTDCGMSFNKHPECCDFHHLKSKDGSVCSFVGYSLDRVFEEIAKCIPLCANCHRIRTENMQVGSSNWKNVGLQNQSS